MKKLISIFLSVIIVFSLSACKNEVSQNKDVFFETTLKSAEQNTDANISETELVETNIIAVLKEDDGYGGGELTLQKYRSIYYCIPSPFWDIINEDEREDIYGDYWQKEDGEIDIMRMRVFVEEFNVPREKFDAANAEWARRVEEMLYGTPIINPQDYANQEFDEVYNADIIYTFDNEIINEYYLSHDYPYCYESEYEKALEEGVYETQTKEIIDLSTLEDEIILYNELKAKKTDNTIQSETTTDIPEETEITE